MTGPELRAALASWGISHGVLADELALAGYAVEPSTIAAWKAIPPVAEQMVERWRADPALRPEKRRKTRRVR